ncbi:hypothetical protein EJC51_21075 [Streptomyces aquilus]|uniref:Uncharacterized protein n=1 Tax=Streptomyces aquilus TaxID=2548456 RepID=A0A3Q9BZQ8_9ACTN|nr:hypothetical protein [Streptomyces aquilus]AZP18363.1 hypothetical protein EJC51_21075 [Streptomyces aquilus]
MRVRCFRSRPGRWGGHAGAVGLMVVLGLGAVTGCGASAGADGDDPGGGGPAPAATGSAGAQSDGDGYGSGGSGGAADGSGGGGGGANGDPGVSGVAPPSDIDNWDSISVGLDGGIGGVDSACPSPQEGFYPDCSLPPSPTDGGGESPVIDPPVGDSQPPVDPSAAPGDDGAGLTPEPT